MRCADEQQDVPLDLDRWRSLALDVLAAQGVGGRAELSVLFVDEPEMRALNHEHMGEARSTDVLAFPIDLVDLPTPADQPRLLGDVVICPAVAAKQAPEHAGTLDDELALLLVHGTLHVLGFDHAEADERAQMRARERELLEQLHWRSSAPAGFRQDHVDVSGAEGEDRS